MSNSHHKVLKSCSSKLIYETRIKNNCSQHKFSEMIALSPRAYEDLELGKSLPKFQTLVNIAIAGNLDLNSLVDQIKSNGYKIEDSRNE